MESVLGADWQANDFRLETEKLLRVDCRVY
jgi:hypothetical protein